MKRTRVDAELGLAEVFNLWTAETADALHRVLLLHAPVRQFADTFEPFQLLVKHHETEPETSLRNCSGGWVIRAVCGGGPPLVARVFVLCGCVG